MTKRKHSSPEPSPVDWIGVFDVDAITDRRLTRGALACYIYFATQAGRGGTTRVSREQTAADLRVTPVTVSRYRTQLEAGGYITTRGRGRATPDTRVIVRGRPMFVVPS